MGRRSHRRRAADWIEEAVEALEPLSDPAERAARERRRDERRRAREAAAQRRFLAVGAGLLAGGVAAMLGLFAVAAVGVGFIAAWLVQSLARFADGGGQARLAQLRQPKLETPAVAVGGPEARRELVRGVLDEAIAHLRSLAATRAALAEDDPAGPLLDRLVRAGDRLVAAVAAAPERLEPTKRLFTYHLPAAARIAAEVLAQAPADAAGSRRREDARLTLARLDNLMEKIELDLRASDAREMDLELRLINQALDEDMAERRRS